jgi:4-hydroxybenzoate polyprenyltransferase/phosphoserine phosphatase
MCRRAKAAVGQAAPLCIDLDGTLLRTDMLVESLIRAIRQDWTTLLWIPLWLVRGRAHLKRRLAERVAIDAAQLPFHSGLLDYLRAQRRAGRWLVLCTAGDQRVATIVADHLALFDEVIGSDGSVNLKAGNKADFLVQHFGHRGYAYAGDSASDLAVWRHAYASIPVGTGQALARRAAELAPVELDLSERPRVGRELLRGMRLYQWVKNTLIFLPVITGLKLFDFAVMLPVVVVFIAFGMAASGSYLLNDLMDLEADRAHPRKCRRPFASGSLPLKFGLAAPLLVVCGLAAAAIVSVWCALLIGFYVVLSLTYSAVLKKQPLVDVFTLAALYSTRVFAGNLASGLETSIWLLSFSGFFFLALAFLKRSAEFMPPNFGESETTSRRGYGRSDVPMLGAMGVASSFVSCLVLSLYLDSVIAQTRFHNPEVLWGLVPLLLFWQCRLWLSTIRGQMNDDPIVYAARDQVSWIVFLMAVILYLGASIDISFGGST